MTSDIQPPSAEAPFEDRLREAIAQHEDIALAFAQLDDDDLTFDAMAFAVENTAGRVRVLLESDDPDAVDMRSIERRYSDAARKIEDLYANGYLTDEQRTLSLNGLEAKAELSGDARKWDLLKQASKVVLGMSAVELVPVEVPTQGASEASGTQPTHNSITGATHGGGAAYADNPVTSPASAAFIMPGFPATPEARTEDAGLPLPVSTAVAVEAGSEDVETPEAGIGLSGEAGVEAEGLDLVGNELLDDVDKGTADEISDVVGSEDANVGTVTDAANPVVVDVIESLGQDAASDVDDPGEGSEGIQEPARTPVNGAEEAPSEIGEGQADAATTVDAEVNTDTSDDGSEAAEVEQSSFGLFGVSIELDQEDQRIVIIDGEPAPLTTRPEKAGLKRALLVAAIELFNTKEPDEEGICITAKEVWEHAFPNTPFMRGEFDAIRDVLVTMLTDSEDNLIIRREGNTRATRLVADVAYRNRSADDEGGVDAADDDAESDGDTEEAIAQSEFALVYDQNVNVISINGVSTNSLTDGMTTVLSVLHRMFLRNPDQSLSLEDIRRAVGGVRPEGDLAAQRYDDTIQSWLDGVCTWLEEHELDGHVIVDGEGEARTYRAVISSSSISETEMRLWDPEAEVLRNVRSYMIDYATRHQAPTKRADEHPGIKRSALMNALQSECEAQGVVVSEGEAIAVLNEIITDGHLHLFAARGQIIVGTTPALKRERLNGERGEAEAQPHPMLDDEQMKAAKHIFGRLTSKGASLPTGIRVKGLKLEGVEGYESRSDAWKTVISKLADIGLLERRIPGKSNASNDLHVKFPSRVEFEVYRRNSAEILTMLQATTEDPNSIAELVDWINEVKAEYESRRNRSSRS